MKALSSAGFLAGGLAIGIFLGRGPISPEPSPPQAPDTAAAGSRPGKTGRAANTSLHPGVSTIRQADPAELAALAAQAASMSDPVEIRRLLAECLLHMTAENWRDVIASFDRISKATGRDQADEWKLALFRSGQLAGPEAMDLLATAGLKDNKQQCWQTLYGWGTKDARGALAWLAKAEAEGRATTNDHYTALISGAALSDPHDALKLLEEIPAERRKDCAGNLVWNLVQNGGIGALDPFIEYASKLDVSQSSNLELANDLFYEAREKLLWTADHCRDVQQACDVVSKLAEYGRDPNELTQAALRKYRYYYMPEKLKLLETVSSGPLGSELELGSLTSTVMDTMNGDQDRAAVREWMSQHPDSPLIPHLQTRITVE
jgi:hypothetical protein